MLTGIVMGDGCVERNDGTRNPCINISMTNEDFLHWVAEKLGIFARSVKLKKTAKEKAATSRKYGANPEAKEENYNDEYVLRTCSHPSFDKLAKWYSSGKKQLPENLNLTPLITKMWYVCDGNLNDNGHISIGCANEMQREEYLISLFEEVGVSPVLSYHSLTFTQDDSRKLLNWMGRAPDGFEYKWGN